MTHNPAPHVTLFRSEATPEVRTVQVAPSGEVTIVPPCPTATNIEFAYQMPQMPSAVPEARAVHVEPSGEVKIVPPAPETT